MLHDNRKQVKGEEGESGEGGESAKMLVMERFWVMLVLRGVMFEAPLPSVCQDFGVTRGTLQTLQSLASTFAGRPSSVASCAGGSCRCSASRSRTGSKQARSPTSWSLRACDTSRRMYVESR